MNSWLEEHLVCPRDKNKLNNEGKQLVCPVGHTYPIVQGIPVMLVDDAESTHGYIEATLEKISKINQNDEDSSSNPKIGANNIDDYVQKEVPYTSGNLYFSIQNKLTRYPIPILRLPDSKGERLLDIGCNWGRWSIAASQKGYKVIGMDPSLDAVLAAKRVSKQLNLEPDFIVGDARFLPFETDAFDVVFSYGVFQHFSKENAKISFDEISRVLKKGNKTYLQMPNKYGVRQYYQYWKRGFTEGEAFEVRYWTPSELLKTFKEKFGETEISTDCYFGLGIQKSDVDLLPAHFKAVVHSSEILKKISQVFPPLIKVADSVYLVSKNQNKSK